MPYEKEMVAPYAPIGVGAEQTINTNYNNIITDESENFNSYIQEMQMEVIRSMDPSYMKTVSMTELFENVYRSTPPIIDGLLYSGVYLFVGAPKIGKSFFMAQLAYHISNGIPLWNYNVHQGTVLYLALEDDYRRLQERLYRMFGTEGTDKLYFSVSANSLKNGLDEQLKGFIEEHSDTNLIIIDTLQKVREACGESYSYANDYEIIAKLKRFADSNKICLMLVHHTRKQSSDDKFDMISGTNGLLGAADGAFLLHKEKRTDNTAILEISGRDQQDQKLYITRNTEKLSWDLERTETKLWEKPSEPILEAVSKLITADMPDWCGTPTEFAAAVNTDIPVNSLTKKLNVNAGRLMNEYGIYYKSSRTHDGRKIEFHFMKRCP